MLQGCHMHNNCMPYPCNHMGFPRICQRNAGCECTIPRACDRAGGGGHLQALCLRVCSLRLRAGVERAERLGGKAVKVGYALWTPEPRCGCMCCHMACDVFHGSARRRALSE